MATVYYGLNKGQHTQDVAVQTSTNSTSIELRVDEAAIGAREDALVLLDYLKNALINNAYPFA